jgi:hypothetical protein
MGVLEVCAIADRGEGLHRTPFLYTSRASSRRREREVAQEHEGGAERSGEESIEGEVE